jgi:hypothetical protein
MKIIKGDQNLREKYKPDPTLLLKEKFINQLARKIYNSISHSMLLGRPIDMNCLDEVLCAAYLAGYNREIL